MSGDVQPRKRKDKKRKKDELGIEEPRGTAAVLGEGDVFMHSQHEHGTGGHWCAKIIFFSLLAVLITLIGLIILENRGLTELEANSVESRYSGVLEGWLEDAPDDDHHDEHTLELKHHDDEGDHDDHSPEVDHDDDDDDHDDDEHEVGEKDDEVDHEDEDEDDHDDGDEESPENGDESQENDDDDDDDEDDHEQEDDNDTEEPNLDEDDEQDIDDDDEVYKKNEESEENDDDDNNNDDDDDDDDDDLQKVDDEDSVEGDNDDDSGADNQSVENDDVDDDSTNEVDQDDNDSSEDKDEEEHEEEAEDSGIEVEKLEKEVTDEDALSEEQASNEANDDDDDDKSEELSNEATPDDDDDVSDDEEFLETDDIEEDLPVVEHIVAPKGHPLDEVEEESTVKPADTLAEEEEYEKQQEELRREQEQASHMWLKLVVGGALLVATHAVVRRATAARDDTPASEEHASREDTPSMVDRRMTLISPEPAAPATRQLIEEELPLIEEQIVEKVSSVIETTPPNEESEEELEEEEEEEIIVPTKAPEPSKTNVDKKELYSDEEEEDVEEEELEEEEKIVEKIMETPKLSVPVAKQVEPEPDDEVPDDVEIIDDEQLEEEEEQDEDEEEISDVDDAELLHRLELKYGRIPEPERPGPKTKDGGNSIEDEWPGEPADQYWRQQLDQAEEELRQGSWRAASERVTAAALRASARAKWLAAGAVDAEAEARRDNRLLSRAITAYLEVLKMNEKLSDARLQQVADRILDRIRFRGNYLSAEPVYRLLIRRFPDVVDYRNNLTVTFLMANRAYLAEEVIRETLKKWPDDRVSLAHLGFVLKTQHNKLEEAVDALQKALKGDIGPATEPRFYYHLGDALLLLGRFEEAHEVHKRGTALGHFLSPAQRSLYNVERLKSQPWWDTEKTPYLKLARALEKSWKEILKEGEAARALYEKEKEGLKERGEWSQLDLFVRGQEIPDRCKRAPVTCSIVRAEAAAAGCRRGQIKFSSMEAGTHVRPHVGPTNCRLRMHLGLSNTKDTYIRVDKEIRQWQLGKVLMFDDSFEHEVWHNGTGTRLVLIVDVWHPALTAHERRTLPAI